MIKDVWGKQTSSLDFQRDLLLRDARQDINELGGAVTFVYRTQSEISRDKYGSIKSRNATTTKLTIYAYPINFQPNRRELDKAGLKEEVEVMIQTAMLDWMELNYEFYELDKIFSTVIINGGEYEIREKALVDQSYDTHLHVSLGLNKI